MAKWCGHIGYAEHKETSPGYWEEVITERLYYGDVIRNTRMLENSGGMNDNVAIANQISIVSDMFAYQNIHAMRYIEFMGTKWKVSTVDASQYPRLVLSMGDVWNGQTARTS